MSEKTSDSHACPKDVSVSPFVGSLERSQRVRDLKERVERGEYEVDLPLLACLLIDSHAALENGPRPSVFT